MRQSSHNHDAILMCVVREAAMLSTWLAQQRSDQTQSSADAGLMIVAA
jgi:hypothetical protein